MTTHRNAVVILLVTKLYTSQSTLAVAVHIAVQAGSESEDPPVTSVYGTPLSTLAAQQMATLTAHSTSAIQNPPPLLITPPAVCSDCYLAMGTISSRVQNVSGAPTIELVLTAYSITSAYLSNGVCITTSGVPIMLPEDYTVTSPVGVFPSEFSAEASEKFVSFLGLSTCSGSGEEFLPTPIIQVTNISVTPAPSASLPAGTNSTTSPTLHSSNATTPTATPRLDERAKIGIDIAAFFVFLVLIFLPAFLWYRRRLLSAAINAKKQGETENEQEGTSASEGKNQLYLQQKAELEAEERQRHELEAQQKIYELDGETGINEIPAGTYEHRLAVMRSRQELRGGEHSQELG